MRDAMRRSDTNFTGATPPQEVRKEHLRGDKHKRTGKGHDEGKDDDGGVVWSTDIPGSRSDPEDADWPRPYTLLDRAAIFRTMAASADPSRTQLGGGGRRADAVNFQPWGGPEASQDRYVVKQLDIGGRLWTVSAVFDGHLGNATVAHAAHHVPIIILEQLTALLARHGGSAADARALETVPPPLIADTLSRAVTAFDDAIANDVLELFPGGLDALAHTPDDEISAVLNDQRNGGENFRKAQLCMYGTTAVVALVDPEGENLWVVNLGDCQAIMVAVDAEGEPTVEVLTNVHNADCPPEVERVRSEHPGEEPVIDGRVLGAIAPSRCIGDAPFKQPPEFTRRILYNLFPGHHADTSPWEEFLVHNHTPPYISATPEITHYPIAEPSSPTAAPAGAGAAGAGAGAGAAPGGSASGTKIGARRNPRRYLILCSDGFTDVCALPSQRQQRVVEAWARECCRGPALPAAAANSDKRGTTAEEEENLALRLLWHAFGGTERSVSRALTVDMGTEAAWLDDMALVVQTLDEKGQIKGITEDLTAALEDIGSIIQYLAEKKASLECMRREHARFSSVVGRLPGDVLSIIFEHGIPSPSGGRSDPSQDDPLLSVKVAWVCRRWRTVALSNPKLWNKIHLDGSKVVPGASSPRFAELAARCRAHPTYLFIRSPKFSELEESGMLEGLRGACRGIEAQSQREEPSSESSGSLARSNLSQPRVPIPDRLPHSFSQLSNLYIQFAKARNAGFRAFDPRAIYQLRSPTLRRLVIHALPIPCHSTLDTNQLATSFPGLEELRIFGHPVQRSRAQSLVSSEPPTRTALFSQLRALSLVVDWNSVEGFIRAFQPLVLPALSELNIAICLPCNEEGVQTLAVEGCLARSRCPLERMNVVNMRESACWVDAWVERLRNTYPQLRLGDYHCDIDTTKAAWYHTTNIDKRPNRYWNVTEERTLQVLRRRSAQSLRPTGANAELKAGEE
ncbi:protein serine threonine phosphatase 2C [Coniophora puteana RWD-64-598 SS2]|uniref:Protein serine threonine phosphatase 2C n=1 Tax=Coniophora puteana (strain RWD-64-598) TaxID=741705 RepID=A0A5M3N2J3_CONPW|nr:protein serine threonine phosphatase 2C [Coniophora puteana RWD-64-598 SS2]EIW85610.1 protein serine threonine phosphatase 2C [Coniophora puteana RWD-64-598 SS2]